MDINKFTCSNIIIFEALRKIDINKKKFLIVLDKSVMVFGTLTDGDIRRALISGKNVQTNVYDICNKSFQSLDIRDSINKAIEIFKNSSIDFLPIIENGKLVNIITKNQLHSLLLQDIKANLDYDFFNLDESIVDANIYPRPWGFYKSTVLNKYYQSKIISINPLEELSLQSHEHRDEYWTITHGEGEIVIGNDTKKVKPGDMLFIPRSTKHQARNINNKETLLIIEVQLGEDFDEEDIIRYEDKYGRVQ